VIVCSPSGGGAASRLSQGGGVVCALCQDMCERECVHCQESVCTVKWEESVCTVKRVYALSSGKRVCALSRECVHCQESVCTVRTCVKESVLI